MIKPMLCRTWEDATPEPQDYPVYVQPKLDGIRCIVSCEQFKGESPAITAQSRNGKPLVLPAHIEHALAEFYDTHSSDIVLDGELYAHGLSFQEVASRIKRVVHGTHPDVQCIRYCVYDIVDESLSFDERLEWMFANLPHTDSDGPFCRVRTVKRDSEELVTKAHISYVAEGYEGSIIRLPGGKYEQGKRSRNLLKRKDWEDEDFNIIAINEGLGKNAGTAVLTLVTANGSAFTVTAPGDYVQKSRIWQHRDYYLRDPHVCIVKYQELTDDGIPRFPVAIGIKEKGI